MCGRYAIISPPEDLKALFGYCETPNFPPRTNIAPTQPVPVVHLSEGQRRFTLMRWGFVPGWVKELKGFPLIINIRSETIREKASFRAAFSRRRALMPADAFYEWQRFETASRPFMLRRPDRKPFGFAALWETWSANDGSEIDTVALINTTANGVIAAIHERSPVILPEADFEQWLDPMTTPEAARKLMRPPAEDLLELVPISTAVNKVANDGPDVQQEVKRALAPEPHVKSAIRQNDGKQGQLF